MQQTPTDALSCVLVSHEDPVTRLGLAAALQQSALRDGVQICNPRADGAERMLETAGIVITDYDHGVELCLQARDRIASRSALTHVIVVTGRDGEHEIRCAIDAGVKGYLLSGCEIAELVEGVRIVSGGVRHLCSAAAHRVLDSMSREPLTGREIQVLQCLVDGHVNKRICNELGIALGTVKAHVKSIFSKLGVSTRTQAVSLARSRGIIPPPGTIGAGTPGISRKLRASMPTSSCLGA